VRIVANLSITEECAEAFSNSNDWITIMLAILGKLVTFSFSCIRIDGRFIVLFFCILEVKYTTDSINLN